MDISNQRELAWQRIGDGPFLLWKKPRLSEIYDLIGQGQSLPNSNENPASLTQVQEKLIAYMEAVRAEKAAQGATFPLAYSVRLRDLPPDFRAPLASYAQEYLKVGRYGNVSGPTKSLLNLFDAKSWETVKMKAKVFTQPDGDGNPRSQLMLEIEGNHPDGSSFGFGILLKGLN